MPRNILLSRLDWSNLKERRNKQKALIMFRIVNGMTPTYLTNIFSSNIGRSVSQEVETQSSLTGGQNGLLPEELCLYWGKGLECLTRRNETRKNP